MKKQTINSLICVNTHSSDLSIFALKAIRKGDSLYSLDFEDLEEDDEIITGLIYSKDYSFTYPIIHSIPLLISIGDANDIYIKYLETIRKKQIPDKLKNSIENNLKKIKSYKKDQKNIWNIEEAEYYNKGFETDELINKAAEDVKDNALWGRYINQKKVIFNNAKNEKVKNVLEVGCGNSRSIFHCMNPEKYNLNYVGTDISINRLLIAKKVIPNADFIVCSASNLPFRDAYFDLVFGLGVYHHLPNLKKALNESVRCLSYNGFIGFTEPVDKPKVIDEDGFIAKLLNTYEHSDHDNEIDEELTIDILYSLKINTINKYYFSSNIIQLLFIKLPGVLFKKSLLFSYNYGLVYNFLEQIYLRIFGKLFKPFGLGYGAIGFFGKKIND
jgi:ubiquinone/menaquinone biosynthesis C-methylase UbiE